MPRRRQDLLDTCLELLRQGVSVEDCLARFPEEREALEPLLRVYLRLRGTWQPHTQEAQAKALARTQFLSEVVRRRAASAQRQTEKGRWSLGSLFARVSLSRGLVTILVTVAMLGGALAGGGIASANSLPGDTLYGVKRARESVSLLVALDEDQRRDLHELYAQRRAQEVKELYARDAESEVSFSGTVDGRDGEIILVDGIPVALLGVDPGRIPDIGERVTIQGLPQKEGQIAATSVELQGSVGVLVTVVPKASPTIVGYPTEEPTTDWTVTPTPSDTATRTRRPSRTPETSATPTCTASATASPTLTPSPTPTYTPTPTLTPTWTDIPTETPWPTDTATPKPPPRPIQVRIEGTIEEIGRDHWVVAGERIEVLSATRIDESAATAEVGGWATVNAFQYPDGDLEAEDIRVERGATELPQRLEFSGRVDDMDDDTWVVAGRTLEIDKETIIEGVPYVGADAHVDADEYSDGRLVARAIRVQRRTAEFQGVVQELHENGVRVSGQEIEIDGDTDIDGDLLVGAIVEVVAFEAGGERWIAETIKVLASPATETPEPTSEPEQAADTTPAPAEVDGKRVTDGDTQPTEGAQTPNEDQETEELAHAN